MELHQSPPYVQFIRLLKWQVETIDGQHIFIRNFPLMGGMAKIQRARPLPSLEHLLPILKKHRVKRVVLEPSEHEQEETLRAWASELKKHVTLISSPYLPSKTLRIDISPSEDHIFSSFSEAKRRAVRRAQKNNIVIEEQPTIEQLILVKNKSAGFMGFITTHGTREMWQAFTPDHATTVLAYSPSSKKPIGGIFLIFWEDIAYYWIAGATKEGKKLFAPTLLVWEAIRIAKKHGAQWFDFVGTWDERFPKENLDWKGFTKFKEGFGGKTLYYPTHRKINSGTNHRETLP